MIASRTSSISDICKFTRFRARACAHVCSLGQCVQEEGIGMAVPEECLLTPARVHGLGKKSPQQDHVERQTTRI